MARVTLPGSQKHWYFYPDEVENGMATVYRYGRNAARRKVSVDDLTFINEGDSCSHSGSRVGVNLADAQAGQTRCPGCRKALRIRTKIEGHAHMATIPQHSEEA